jgi:hypothetical protein
MPRATRMTTKSPSTPRVGLIGKRLCRLKNTRNIVIGWYRRLMDTNRSCVWVGKFGPRSGGQPKAHGGSQSSEPWSTPGVLEESECDHSRCVNVKSEQHYQPVAASSGCNHKLSEVTYIFRWDVRSLIDHNRNRWYKLKGTDQLETMEARLSWTRF